VELGGAVLAGEVAGLAAVDEVPVEFEHLVRPAQAAFFANLSTHEKKTRKLKRLKTNR
jgi:hypothetical protein